MSMFPDDIEPLDFDPVFDLGFEPEEAKGKQRHYLTSLAEHLDLMQWVRSPEGEDEVGGLYSGLAYDEEMVAENGKAIPPEAARAAGAKMARRAAMELNRGMTLYVAPSMVTMLEAATNGLQGEATLTEEDLPAESGFVRFGRPVYVDWEKTVGRTVTDLRSLAERPTPVAVRALVWWMDESPFGPSLQMLWFAHRDDPQDPWAQAEWLTSNDMDLVREWVTYAGGDATVEDKDARAAIVERLVSDPEERARRWRVQPRWLLDGQTGWTIGAPVEKVGATAKMVAALFLLLQQRIGTVTGVAPDRRLDKQAKRAKHTPDIRVVMLRRRVPRDPSKEDGEQVEVKWNHRWLVQGHWRNQWYPSLGRHRRIWIAPFVKGPEDLPLVVKDVIYAMER